MEFSHRTAGYDDIYTQSERNLVLRVFERMARRANLSSRLTQGRSNRMPHLTPQHVAGLGRDLSMATASISEKGLLRTPTKLSGMDLSFTRQEVTLIRLRA